MRTRDYLIPLVIAGVALCSHFWWLGSFRVPPEGDHGFHLAEAAAFQSVMQSPGGFLDKVLAAWSWPGPYSSFVYLVTWLWGAVGLGTGSQAAVASFAFFIVLLVVGAYIIGRDIGGPATGAAAALLACMDPVLLNNERRYFLDMPLAAIVVFSMALLLKSRGFRERGWSLAFGVALGLGVLTKYTFVWYAVPAVAVALAGAYRWRLLAVLGGAAAVMFLLDTVSVSRHFFLQGSDSLAPPMSYGLVAAWAVACAAWWTVSRRALEGAALNASQALCLGGLLAGPWIIVNQFMIRGRWQPVARAIPENLAHLDGTLRAFLDGVPPPVLALAALGLVAVALVRERRTLLPLVAALLVGFAATVVVLPSTPRYTIPASVLIGVMAVAWMPRVRYAPVFLALVAAQLAAVNLFGQAMLVGSPAWTGEIERLSALTRRSLGDGMGYRTDFEPLSVRTVGALPAAAATLYVMAPREDRLVELCDLYYMLAAHTDWQGRVVEVRLMRPAAGGWAHVHVNPMATDRTRFLAQRSGLPLARYPRIADAAPAPDAMLVEDGGAGATAFGRGYRAVLQADGYTLWQRQDQAAGR